MLLFSKLQAVVCRSSGLLLRKDCHLRFNKQCKSTINIEQSSQHGILIPTIDLEDSGISTRIGKRQYQEDRLSMSRFRDGSLYLGIFDGHGGSLAAEYTVAHMPSVLEGALEKVTSMNEMLEESFIEVNTKLLEYIRKGKESKRYSGTTATVCLIRDDLHLHTASVGDTRAILCRNGEAIALTTDHNPNNVSERHRVEEEGGLIVSNSLGEPLVNGRLAMTRSIGDFDLKPYGVTSRPECTYMQLKPARDSFLVLITDGVSFTLPDQEVADIVLSCGTPQQAADQVTDVASIYGSVDNTSVIVLALGSWGRFEPSSGYVPNRTLFNSRD